LAEDGGHYAEAEWLDPQGARVALYGTTLGARARNDWIPVGGRQYIPHTFAMAIGTRDLRGDAGQLKLPSTEGQYTIRLRVDGRSLGLAFFRMLRSSQPAPQRAPTQGVPVGAAPAGAEARTTPIPPLPDLKLP
jgi:hypothetical protein